MRTIVTVILESSGQRRDMDLPGDIPLKQLGERISAALDERFVSEGEFRFERSEDGQEWELMEAERTLDEAGILDGCYIRVSRPVSFSTIENRREQAQLFQDVIPLFPENTE